MTNGLDFSHADGRPWWSRFARTWDAISIICLIVAGLIAGVLHLVPSAEKWVPAEPIILVLLGVMGTHFAIERFSTIHRIEEKLSLLNEAVALGDFPQQQQQIHRRATSAYIQLQQIIGKLGPNETSFRKLTEDLLTPLDALLQQLAGGRIIVPLYQLVAMQEALSSAFHQRFDAVCEKDINFWDQSPESEDYFIAESYLRQHVGAIKRRTSHTRMFIVTLRDLEKNRERLTRILTRHQKARIGWGLAIYEELEEPLRITAGRLDFGIFDGGKALSYFQGENPHRFEAVIRLKSLPGNEQLVNLQLDIHQRLIAECWVVSEAFSHDYLNIHDDRANEKLREMIHQYNEYLTSIVDGVTYEHEDFIFVARRPDEIDAKLQQLESLLHKYREGRGAPAPTA